MRPYTATGVWTPVRSHMLSSPLGSHRQRAEPRWIRSVRGKQERNSRRAQPMIQSDVEDVNRKAASLLQQVYHSYWWRSDFGSYIFCRAALGIVPFLFFFSSLPFVCDRYGSGLHIRATMPWLHYCLKTGGEVKGPCITFFPTVADIFLFSTVKAGTERRCPTKEFGGMALWSCG